MADATAHHEQRDDPALQRKLLLLDKRLHEYVQRHRYELLTSPACGLVRLPRTIKQIGLRLDFPNIAPHRWVPDAGYAMIKSICYYHDDLLIDEHYGVFLHVWKEINSPSTVTLKDLSGSAHVELIQLPMLSWLGCEIDVSVQCNPSDYAILTGTAIPTANIKVDLLMEIDRLKL